MKTREFSALGQAPGQALANAAAADLPPLPPELHQRLAAFYRDKVSAQIRGPY